ncbi:hypothetical protein KC717_02070 [Candidatus Dojkabacteria bacterium]|uniref:Prepilin-type N-terminal cleavage/methylation domain-containing protein n=1 Tax=Candidatus Dojkabacteria bacterium TaxID=2099670 RepID=A0A955L823_9BACT|nr:hypothetical protein [Candidatus Dojkabacteria bacterium]
MKKLAHKSLQGFSLMEITIVLGLLSIIITSIIFLALDTIRFNENNSRRVDSSIFIQENINALLINKQDLWSDIIIHTNDGPKYLSFENNRYVIEDGENTQNGITFSFEITDVYRDSNGDIVPSGGTLDINSRLVTTTTSWTDTFDNEFTDSSDIYISNWSTPQWLETTSADFSTGVLAGTQINGALGGEIELESTSFPDWCEPEFNVSSFDLNGNGWPQSVVIVGEDATLGTKGNGQGVTFSYVQVTDGDPPLISELGNYDTGNELTYDHDAYSNYAFLASTHNSKELQVLDISQDPIVEVAYFDAPFWSDAAAVAYDPINQVTFLGQVRKFIAVDTSFPPSGVLSSLDILDYRSEQGQIQDIAVWGDYAYVAWLNNPDEIMIVDISDPNNLAHVTEINVNNESAEGVHVNTTGDRLYFFTADNHDSEVFIFDISDPTNPIYLSEFESNGTSFKGMSYFEEDQKLIAVGRFGDEYQVIDVSDDNNPFLCGSTEFTSQKGNKGAFDVDTLKTSLNNSYAYTLAGENDAEFKIVRGGPGAGGGGSYVASGTFESSIFDTGSIETKNLSFDWSTDEPNGTDVKLQFKIGNTSNLSGEDWFGPDGTDQTYFEDGVGGYIPLSEQNGRYLQFRVELETNNSAFTPQLHDVVVIYEN